jgi:hypothetical protein
VAVIICLMAVAMARVHEKISLQSTAANRRVAPFHRNKPLLALLIYGLVYPPWPFPFRGDTSHHVGGFLFGGLRAPLPLSWRQQREPQLFFSQDIT